MPARTISPMVADRYMVMETKAAINAVGKKKPPLKLKPCRAGTAQCIGFPVDKYTIATRARSAKREGYRSADCFPLRFRYISDFLIKIKEQIAAKHRVMTVKVAFDS